VFVKVTNFLAVNLPNLQGWFCGAGFPDVHDGLAVFFQPLSGKCKPFQKGCHFIQYMIGGSTVLLMM
jgi:hypothetical protein